MNVLSTSRENIIGDFKLRNNYVTIQLLIFPILRWQYLLFYIDSILSLFFFITLIFVSVLLYFFFALTIILILLLFAIAFKSDNYCFRQTGYTKSKKVENDNLCYRKVGKAITLLRAIIGKS